MSDEWTDDNSRNRRKTNIRIHLERKYFQYLQTTEISTSVKRKMQEVSGKVEPDIFQPKQQRKLVERVKDIYRTRLGVNDPDPGPPIHVKPFTCHVSRVEENMDNKQTNDSSMRPSSVFVMWMFSNFHKMITWSHIKVSLITYTFWHHLMGLKDYYVGLLGVIVNPYLFYSPPRWML